MEDDRTLADYNIQKDVHREVELTILSAGNKRIRTRSQPS
jgi:hypothetical protein